MLSAGHIPLAGGNRRTASLDADLKAMPAGGGNAARREAQDVAAPELVEDSDERLLQVHRGGDFERLSAGLRAEAADEPDLPRASRRDTVDHCVAASRRFQYSLGRQDAGGIPTVAED